MLIRNLNTNDFRYLKDFSPKEWNLDIELFLNLHFNKSYFHAVVVEIDDVITGMGNVIINGNVGWIGNIIVAPEFRKLGIGSKITKFLVEYLKSRNCSHFILIATHEGKKVYERLKFEVKSNYLFYKPKQIPHNKTDKNIRIVKKEDIKKLFFLDKIASGENRENILTYFIDKAIVYEENNKISGFFIPDFAGGVIIAEDDKSGLVLLNYKHTHYLSQAVIPENNLTAKNFLINNGFEQYMTLPRMALGNDVDWKPQMVFSRLAGYCD